MNNHNYVADSVPSNLVSLSIGAFVTSPEDDQAMSDITHQTDFEPMMSGALQDMETDGDGQPSATLASSPYHVPGTFPESPELPRLSSTESPTPKSPTCDALTIFRSICDWWISEAATLMKSRWRDCTRKLRGCSLSLWEEYRTREGWLTMVFQTKNCAEKDLP